MNLVSLFLLLATSSPDKLSNPDEWVMTWSAPKAEKTGQRNARMDVLKGHSQTIHLRYCNPCDSTPPGEAAYVMGKGPWSATLSAEAKNGRLVFRAFLFADRFHDSLSIDSNLTEIRILAQNQNELVRRLEFTRIRATWKEAAATGEEAKDPLVELSLRPHHEKQILPVLGMFALLVLILRIVGEVV